ncbi:MAG: sugar phosphate isomerase/epimerase family protein [Phycisphaerae bacterium]
MKKPGLSVCIEDLRLTLKNALVHARRMGFAAVDIRAKDGPISPAELTRTGQRHLLRHLADLGLRLGSLRGPTGGAGYADPAAGESRLDTMRAILNLASALRVPVVSTTLGQSREEGTATLNDRAIEALEALADDADRLGVMVAVETTGMESRQLGDLLARINCPGLGACCDSGAMLMQGEDPHRLADTLAGRVRLVRARDAVAGTESITGHEVALGEGDLDIRTFWAGLRESGFTGDIVLSRTTGSNPTRDLLQAKERFESIQS